MRVIVILVPSSSSIVTPPNPLRHNHHYPHLLKASKSQIPNLSPSNLPPPPWSSSRSPPLSTALRWDPTETHPRSLADFANNLARDGKLVDFAMVVETVADSGVEASQFKSALRANFVEKCLSGFLRDGKVQSFVNVLNKLDEFGFPPLEIFTGSAMDLLRKECRGILKFRDHTCLGETDKYLATY